MGSVVSRHASPSVSEDFAIRQAAVKTRLPTNGKQIRIMAEMQIRKSLQQDSGNGVLSFNASSFERLENGKSRAIKMNNL
jgi:hypothetical protein